MSGDSDTDSHPAHVIVAAGEILQTLNPSRLATLLFVIDDSIETQVRMAEMLGVSTSTITTNLQSLANLPIPLAQKRGTEYSITDDGKTILGLVDRTLGSLGKNLSQVDWDESDKDRIGALLAPLPDSRSALPFFVLASISRRNELSDTQGIQINDVVDDVRRWEQERGQTTTRKQVRWMLGRFEEAGAIAFNGQEQDLTLEEKGHELAQLLEDLIELLEDGQDDADEVEEETADTTKPATAQQPTTDAGDAWQIGATASGSVPAGETETVTTLMPTYCVAPDELDSEEGQTRLEPLLPLRPMISVDELYERVGQLRREYPGEMLELHRVLWSNETSESERERDAHNEVINNT